MQKFETIRWHNFLHHSQVHSAECNHHHNNHNVVSYKFSIVAKRGAADTSLRIAPTEQEVSFPSFFKS